MRQIDGSYESHILIGSIQCNCNNVLTKADFMKLDPDTETETETESGDERKWKGDKKMETESFDTN